MWFLARRFVLGCLMSYNTIIISVFLRRIDGGKHNVRLKYEYWFSIIGTTIEETTNITSNISRRCDWNCSSKVYTVNIWIMSFGKWSIFKFGIGEVSYDIFSSVHNICALVSVIISVWNRFEVWSLLVSFEFRSENWICIDGSRSFWSRAYWS